MKKLLPTSVTLITSNQNDENDAKLYLEGKTTKMGYSKPTTTLRGAFINLKEKGFQQKFIESIYNAPECPILPPQDMNSKSTLSVYITHHLDSIFPLEKLATAFNILKRKPYIYIYYDIATNLYTVQGVNTFSRHQFYLTRVPFSFNDLSKLINKTKAELKLNKLELYTHAHLGEIDGDQVTVCLDSLITQLKPSYIGLFYKNNSRKDTLIYYHRGITAQGYQLPRLELTGDYIDENILTNALNATEVVPEMLSKITSSSSIIPSFSGKKSLSIFIFEPSANENSIESLISLCGEQLNLIGMIVHYNAAKNNFLINKILSDEIPLGIPSETNLSKDKLTQYILKTNKCLNRHIQLYCPTSLGNPNGNKITEIVNNLVHDIRPTALYLFYNSQNFKSAVKYLNREADKDGFILPPIDMYGCCLDELNVYDYLFSNNAQNIEYLNSPNLLDSAIMLRSPIKRPISKRTMSHWLCYLFSRPAIYERQSEVSEFSEPPSELVMHQKPSLSMRPASTKFFGNNKGNNKICPTKTKEFRYNVIGHVRYFSPNQRVSDTCGFLKLTYSPTTTYTIKDILHLFKNLHGILLYKDDLFHINPDALLRYNPKTLFNQEIKDELILHPSRQNMEHFKKITEYFEQINANEYHYCSPYLTGLFCGLTQSKLGKQFQDTTFSVQL